MLAPGSTLVRSARAIFVSLWVIVGAVLAHATQSGSAPPLVALVPVVGATTAIVWWAGSRRLRFGTVLVLLALSQLAVHLLSSYVHGHVMTPSLLMVVAHLASVALVAAGIAKVEQLWWSWWDRVTTILRLGVWPVPAMVAVPVHVTPRAREHGDLLAHVVRRRGPPVS